MLSRTLGVSLAVAFTAACASFHAPTIPKWERYQQGELAGFLRGPGEQPAQAPAQSVRTARGTVQFPRDRIMVPA